MVISTDQMNMELKKSSINQALALEPVNNNVNVTHLISILQTTIHLDELLPIFSTALETFVNHSGFTFEHDDLETKTLHGQRTNHNCEYSLAIESTSLGKITFMRRQRFLESELAIIESFLSALLHPLKNTLLYRKALQLAHTDPLTGVLNRSTLQSVFQQETAVTKRHSSHLSLVMLDIDCFKAVNDNYGHAAGDEALKTLTDCIKHTARESDHIFRLGGEEFAVLLHSTDIKGANLLAERLRKAVELINIKHSGNDFGFTVSMGITEYRDNETLENTMSRADNALYEAKDSGRNRVICA